MLYTRDGGGLGRPVISRDFSNIRRAGLGRAEISKLYNLLILNNEFFKSVEILRIRNKRIQS